MTSDDFSHRVRALERGLSLLALLNQYNGLSMPDLTEQTGLTRSAVYRILATLIEADYVFKSPSDGLYRVTAKVRDLSMGYTPDPWVKTVAAPVLDRAGENVAWPLSVVVLRNNQLTTAYNTDRNSPLVVRRISAGTTIPLSGTAAGLVFLSFAEPDLADALKQSMLFTEQSLLAQDKLDLDRMNDRIATSRSKGFCIHEGASYRALAVPMYRSGKLAAAITMRSNANDAWPEKDDHLYLSTLKSVARDLENAS